MTEVFLVVNYFEGQPEVRCAHPTREVAEACCRAQANVRARAHGLEEAWVDSQGDFFVSSHEWFRVCCEPVVSTPCKGKS